MVSQFPLELIYHILRLVPDTRPSSRASTLRACALVNKTWRVVAQKELPRQLEWWSHRRGRLERFLASPSGRDGWHSDWIILVCSPVDELDLLVRQATSIKRIDLRGPYGDNLLYRLDGLELSLSGE